MYNRRRLAATDELHDLDLSAILYDCSRPCRLADDIPVILDCNAVLRNFEFAQEIYERHTGRELATVSIYLNLNDFACCFHVMEMRAV